MSAVRLSAAVTAYALIHMYPYISRDDCYYTDTDSVVLRSPLLDEVISSIAMGKFKLEHFVKRGIFLAPKSYMLVIEDDRHIIEHKGPTKDLITSEWFQRQLADLSLMEQISTSANFRIDWKELKIVKKDFLINLGLPQSTKRDNVYDDNNVWIDTRPREVIDLGSKDATTIYISELLREKAKDPVITDKSTKQEEVSQSPTEGQKTKPTLYSTKAAWKAATKEAAAQKAAYWAKQAAAQKAAAKKEGNKDHRPKPDE